MRSRRARIHRKAATMASEPTVKPLLTHSRRQTHRDCAYKDYLTYILGLRPIEEREPLRVGHWIHKGLDWISRGVAGLRVVHDIRAAYAEQNWGDEFDRAIEVEKILALLWGYQLRWQNDPLEYFESELFFCQSIVNPDTGRPTPNYSDAGLIDKIARSPWGPSGRLCVVEHKTTSDDIAPDSDYWNRLRINTQISGYFLRAKQLGHDVKFILYDVIRKPGIRPKQVNDLDKDGKKIVNGADGKRVFKLNDEPRESGDSAKGYVLQTHLETPAEYGNRLQKDIADNLCRYYARKEIPRLDEDLIEYQRDLWSIQRMIRYCEKEDYWPKNDARCGDFGGCEFRRICHNVIDPTDAVPDGFHVLTQVHPELEEHLNGKRTSTTNNAADTATAAYNAGQSNTIGGEPSSLERPLADAGAEV